MLRSRRFPPAHALAQRPPQVSRLAGATVCKRRARRLPAHLAAHSADSVNGHFVIRRAKISYLDNQKASEKIQHMAEKLSLRYVEIRGLF